MKQWIQNEDIFRVSSSNLFKLFVELFPSQIVFLWRFKVEKFSHNAQLQSQPTTYVQYSTL